MFHPKKFLTALGVSALVLAPLSSSFGFLGAAPAHAEKGGNGGGNGNGNGGGNGKGSGDSSSKSGTETGGKPVKEAKSAKPASHPSNLGKMNGALNASMKAVLAHIKNGQTTRGPVGLFAGLAAADSILVSAAAEQAGLLADAAAFERLEKAIQDSGIAGVTDLGSYFSQYDPSNPATQDPAIDSAVAALGGDSATSTGPTTTKPSDAELADAAAAVAAAQADVVDAEGALLDAANKDQMDGETLISSLRERVAGYEDQIAALTASN
jgi:hypothetical protein